MRADRALACDRPNEKAIASGGKTRIDDGALVGRRAPVALCAFQLVLVKESLAG